MTKNIIVAIADNYAIGRKNQLLWHISEDLQYFKKTTTGCPVIMGYMTYLSIGRPLPKRKNFVISIFPWPDAPEGVTVVGSLSEAYAAAGDGDVFVMGGGETYRNALPTADKLYITHVHTTIEDADTWFPSSIRLSGRWKRPPRLRSIRKAVILLNSPCTAASGNTRQRT